MSDNIRRFREAGEIYASVIEEVRKKLVRKEKHKFVIDTGKLKGLAPAATYLYEILSPYGFNEAHVKEVLRSLGGTELKVFEAPYWTLVKERAGLVLSPRKIGTERETHPEYVIRKGRKSQFIPVRLTLREFEHTPGLVIPTGKEFATLDAGKLEFPLRLRHWRPGDAFLPFGLNRKKKVSDFFIDSKLTREEKENTWILWSGNKIVWIVGMRIDNRFRVTAKTRRVLEIRVRV